MAGEEPVERSQSRTWLDLNLYTSLPLLSGRPGRLGGAMDCPVPTQLPEMPIAEVPTDEPTGWLVPEEIPLQPAVYSPSNALSMPELSTLELSTIDPIIIEWLYGLTSDGEWGLNAGEPAELPSNDANVSPPGVPPLLPTLTGLEGVSLEWVERLSHPVVVPPAVPVEMVSATRGHGGAAIEEMTPELRLKRLIQVSEQHCIMSPGPVTHNQQSIKRSHNSLGASRGPFKDGNCGCNSSFECYICLEAAKEPVVTPCGHLFCWPCLFQWLHGRRVHSKCPVCKGKVLEVNIIPIYGRSGDEHDASNNHIPPRPRAKRTESMRQQLQTQDPGVIANMATQLLENQGMVRAHFAAPTGGVGVTVLPATWSSGRVRRQQRQDNLNSPSQVLLHAGNTASPTPQQGSNPAPHGGIQVPMPSLTADNAAPAIPQQSSSMEQASTSSTVAVIVRQAAQSRRSRASESTTTTRRTRRRRQQ